MDEIPRSSLISAIDKYVKRQTFLPPLFTHAKRTNLGLVITLPALAESDLLQSLVSLKHCELPEVDVEVIVIINHSSDTSKEIQKLNENIALEVQEWAIKNSSSGLKYLVSNPIELPKKHAGAGLARKVAMDEAVRRLQDSMVINPVIAAFDGDATCSKNYLVELWRFFKSNPNSLGCSINFEHPIHDEESFQTKAIIQYELHLRYYQAALIFAGHPYAEFTVGSSMAVTRNAYVLQGGMNRRKAGEDFWFMLKLMMAGEVGTITNSTVFPSDRDSNRVPFGTGRAMLEMKEKNDYTFYTSKFESFIRLKNFLNEVGNLYNTEVDIADNLTLQFLESVNWKTEIAEIKLYTTNYESFQKRFYRWFNVFMVMKFFHFLRDQGEKDVPVFDAAKKLHAYLWDGHILPESELELLQKFRHKKRVQSIDYTP